MSEISATSGAEKSDSPSAEQSQQPAVYLEREATGGATVELTILRDPKELAVPVTLGGLPPNR